MTNISELQLRLNKLREKGAEYETSSIVEKFEEELAETDIIHHALKTGDKIPYFALPNATGNTVQAMDLEGYDWLVISFYRGQWCPYCNLELRALEKAVTSLKNIPAKLLAISPQTPDNSLSTVEKNNLTFEVLSDVGNVVAKQFKLVYTVPDYLNDLYKSYGVDFQFFNGKGKIEMPMPATYVVDKKGIIHQYFVSTYSYERLDPKEIIKFLEQQK